MIFANAAKAGKFGFKATKLTDLARNPDAMPGVKPMAGEWAGFFRLRHGDLRVIYLYDRAKDTIIIAHVGPRGDVYK